MSVKIEIHQTANTAEELEEKLAAAGRGVVEARKALHKAGFTYPEVTIKISQGGTNLKEYNIDNAGNPAEVTAPQFSEQTITTEVTLDGQEAKKT